MAARKTYESTIFNLSRLALDSKVLVLGTGKASQFHNRIAQQYGTNIIGAVAPKREGRAESFLDTPIYGNLREAITAVKPFAVSVFVPLHSATAEILSCIEAEIPLIVAYAEGIPTHDQLKISAALRSQSVSRLIGPNCPGMIIPRSRFKLGIQPLSVHAVGRVGLASRSGTISYELSAQTTELGLGQSIVFGIGGDPFPGTRTAEALEFMLYDHYTEIICLVGEIGGHMEEEVIEVLHRYSSNPLNPPVKPIVGFIAGQHASRGQIHGHAGAIWNKSSETAGSKMKLWREAGIRVADHIGMIGDLISAAAKELDRRKVS